MIWINADDVIAIHGQIIKKSGGSDGLRDRAGLEAAIAAPLQSFDSVDFYPTVIEKIARLGYGLASNHAFVDGNKRIGALMTQLKGNMPKIENGVRIRSVSSTKSGTALQWCNKDI